MGEATAAPNNGLPDSALPDSALRVTVFGPISVVCAGRTIEIERRQVRSVLALLAGRNGRRVTTDTLTEHLWPGSLPDDPRKALNVVIARLRSAVGHDRVRSVGDGYRLDADSTDAQEFLDLSERSRTESPHDALNSLDEALALWTSEPFGNEGDSPALAPITNALREARSYAITRRCELASETGNPQHGLGLALVELEQHAFNERLAIAVAVGLGRGGRRSEALDVLARCTNLLRAEVGVDPSAALLTLERELLDGGVDLVLPPPAQRRPRPSTIVGRHTETSWCLAAEKGRPLAIVGESGMGKSVLLDNIIATSSGSAADPVRVTVSATPEAALEPIAELCTQLVARHPQRTMTPLDLSVFVRLGVVPGEGPAAALSRDALIQRSADVLSSWSDDALLIIDDAQWLDPMTAEVIQATADHARLLLALRPDDSGRFDDVAWVGERFGRAFDPLQVTSLGPLSRADVVELADQLGLGKRSEATAAEVLRRSGGNTLFVRLLLEHVVEDGRAELPTSILVAIQERLDVLHRSSIETLRLAAVIGSTGSLQPLRSLRPRADAELAEAEQTRLIRLDAATDSFEFSHQLVADACEAMMSEGARIHAHDDIGRALEATGAPATEYVRHFAASVSIDPNRAVNTHLDAAAEFIEGFAWELAERQLEAARRIDAQLDDRVAAELAVYSGMVGRVLGRADSVEFLTSGADLARDVDLSLFGVAVIELCGHGRTTRAGSADPVALPYLDHALSLALDDALRAELCAVASVLFSSTDECARGRALYHEALELVGRASDPEVEAAVLANAHLGLAHPDDLELQQRAALRLEQLSSGDPTGLWEAAFLRFGISVVLGDPAALESAVAAMRELTPQVRHRSREFGMAFTEASVAILRGDFDEADELATQAITIAMDRYEPSWVMTGAAALLLPIRAGQGRLGELRPLVEQLITESPHYVVYRVGSAKIAVAEADLVGARADLDVISSVGFTHLPRDLHWTWLMHLLAAPVSEVGTIDEATELFGLLEPYADRMSWSGLTSCGPVAEALALLAGRLDDEAAAARYTQQAATLTARFRSAEDPGERAQAVDEHRPPAATTHGLGSSGQTPTKS